MFHEERVIDGALHYRTNPHGLFFRYSQRELTEMLLTARRKLDEEKERIALALRVCADGVQGESR